MFAGLDDSSAGGSKYFLFWTYNIGNFPLRGKTFHPNTRKGNFGSTNCLFQYSLTLLPRIWLSKPCFLRKSHRIPDPNPRISAHSTRIETQNPVLLHASSLCFAKPLAEIVVYKFSHAPISQNTSEFQAPRFTLVLLSEYPLCSQIFAFE